MKTLPLALFAALILLGWTGLAAGVIAAFAGEPGVTSQAHQHQLEVHGVKPEPQLLSETPPCPLEQAVDGSVPCSA